MCRTQLSFAISEVQIGKMGIKINFAVSALILLTIYSTHSEGCGGTNDIICGLDGHTNTTRAYSGSCAFDDAVKENPCITKVYCPAQCPVQTTPSQTQWDDAMCLDTIYCGFDGHTNTTREYSNSCAMDQAIAANACITTVPCPGECPSDIE